MCVITCGCNFLVIISFLPDLSTVFNFMVSKAISLSGWVMRHQVASNGSEIYILFLVSLNTLKLILVLAIISVVILVLTKGPSLHFAFTTCIHMSKLYTFNDLEIWHPKEHSLFKCLQPPS